MSSHHHTHEQQVAPELTKLEYEELSRRQLIARAVGFASATVFSANFLSACGEPNMVDEYGDQIPGVKTQADQLKEINDPAIATQKAVRLNPPNPPEDPTILIPPGSYVVDGDPALKFASVQIDDIPSRNVIRGMMDVCDRAGLPGVTGMMSVGSLMKALPEIVQEMASRRHRIHSHSMTHNYGISQNIAEIEPMQQLIKQMTGQDNILFTNPGGYVNKSLLNYLAARGMYYRWVTVDMGDWTSPRVSEATLRGRIDRAMANGRHFLLHGSDSHGNTLQALPYLFSKAKSMGIQIVSPEDHMHIGNPTVRAISMLEVQSQLQMDYVESGKFEGISQVEANWLLTLESALENSVNLSKESKGILETELKNRKKALGIS